LIPSKADTEKKHPKSWKDLVPHVLFWMILILSLSFFRKSDDSFLQSFLIEIVNIGFYAAMVYVNIYYLFPTYIRNKNLLPHLGTLVLAAAILTPLKTMTLFLTSPNNPDIQQYYLENQYFIFLSTLFVGIGSSIYAALSDWIKGQQERQELTHRTLQSELNFLKSQINPHFLFNTLNSLYALTLKKSDEAPEIVLRLSEMMRYMLYDCNEKVVPLLKEVNYITNYLELEKIRHGKKMQVELNIEGEARNQVIAPLLFIPFIENSFKHGLSHHINEGFVHINLKISQDEVYLEVQNSKSPHIPQQLTKKSGGIGLKNVQRRLNILYPNQYNLDIVDGPDDYTVNLYVKLIENQTT